MPKNNASPQGPAAIAPPEGQSARRRAERASRWFLAVIMLGLLGWGSVHALGAYRNHQSVWYTATLLLCTVGFLEFWLLMLILGARRLRTPPRYAISPEEQPTNPAPEPSEAEAEVHKSREAEDLQKHVSGQ